MSARIVCGVDGSREGQRAAEVAARLARDLDVRAVLVHVQEEPRDRRVGIPAPARRRRSKRLLRAVADGCCFPPGTELRLKKGEPTVELLAEARGEDAELVVVSTGGLGMASPVLLGGTASGLMLSSPCPVVVVPPLAVPPLDAESMRDVVCVLESRPSDLGALALAADLAKRLGGELHAVSSRNDPIGDEELGVQVAMHVMQSPEAEAVTQVVRDQRAGLVVVGAPHEERASHELNVPLAIALAATSEMPVVVLTAEAELQAGSGHYELTADVA